MHMSQNIVSQVESEVVTVQEPDLNNENQNDEAVIGARLSPDIFTQTDEPRVIKRKSTIEIQTTNKKVKLRPFFEITDHKVSCNNESDPNEFENLPNGEFEQLSKVYLVKSNVI